MNAFQILDKDSNPISIKQLDEEAVQFWNKQLDNKWYATPGNSEYAINWFDLIGYNIAQQTNYYTLNIWKNVLNTMIMTLVNGFFTDSVIAGVNYVEFRLGEDTIQALHAKKQYLEPYINLMNHWASKGYTPKQIVSK